MNNSTYFVIVIGWLSIKTPMHIRVIIYLFLLLYKYYFVCLKSFTFANTFNICVFAFVENTIFPSFSFLVISISHSKNS